MLKHRIFRQCYLVIINYEVYKSERKNLIQVVTDYYDNKQKVESVKGARAIIEIIATPWRPSALYLLLVIIVLYRKLLKSIIGTMSY